ncbi:hypothetical protein P280DRAFT_472597 [Massarina eburnea CBS 473.64]|uniref:U1 snRNP-associated protein Usp104 n=1 Tax=Massarina eburnea CBS 473.64 TaxID=1395130 RepID=A0A6A6RR38_9PLEO|nr:hypothetical protein P280DRAFT_472597 [Massarina eburnea CBS 473.64]
MRLAASSKEAEWSVHGGPPALPLLFDRSRSSTRDSLHRRQPQRRASTMNGYPPPMGMPGMPPPMPPPGPVWKTLKSGEKEYYHNTLTNQTTWDKPEELLTEDERAMLGTPWMQYKNADGRPYWAHRETKQTTWDVPDDVQKNLERIRNSQPPQRPPPNAWAAGPTMNLPTFDHGRNDRERERDSYQPSMRDRRDRDDRESGYGGERGERDRERERQSFAPSNELQFATPQDAEAAFMKVLRQLKVQADWSWTQTVRVGIKDPNWRAIPDPEKREEAFRKYCDDLRAQEKSKEADRQARLHTDFMSMLRSQPEIKYYTKWNTARPILEEETVFRSAKDDHERRQLFEEYITLLKRGTAEKEAKDKKNALDGLEELLQTLDLEPFTRWHTAEEKLEDSMEFSSEKYQSLHRIDVLTTFEKHIRQLQRDHNDRVQADNNSKRRIERQNRDAFRQLLVELQENGTLRYGTKWKDIHNTLQNDPRYIAMLGQPGSSPLDMFWDALEVEDQKFRTLRRHALNALEQHRFEVVATTPFDEFLTIMRSEPRTADIDDQSVRSIFDYVVAKVKRRQDDERRDEEHNERYAMDALRSVIKRLDPPVTLADDWDAVRPRVEKTDEYRALKSESLRQSVFDKYLRRLKEKESDRRERSKREPRDRERERERERDRDRRDRDREYRNGHSDSHRRHRTRTRSPENDPYAAERRQAQQDREARYRNNDSTGLSPPHRRDRERDLDRYERSRQGSGDHYVRERREREAERERSYITRGDPLSRADPRDSVSELDYGDGAGRPVSTRRRRESDESSSRRDNKRARYSPRHDRKSKTPVPESVKVEERALRSGSEEGEIEED